MNKYTIEELFEMMEAAEARIDNHPHGLHDEFIKYQNALLETIKEELQTRDLLGSIKSKLRSRDDI